MPFPLIPVIAGAATSLVGGVAGSLAGRKGGREKDYENRYFRAMRRQGGRADRAEDYYLDEAMDFDPREAMEEYGDAAYGKFSRQLGRDIEGLRGEAVGAGRLDTGFYDVDQGELVSDIANRYQEAISSRALEASGQNLRRLEGIGSYGRGTRNTYLDMIAGGLDRETAERNAKRRMWSGAIGSGAGVAGLLAGKG